MWSFKCCFESSCGVLTEHISVCSQTLRNTFLSCILGSDTSCSESVKLTALHVSWNPVLLLIRWMSSFVSEFQNCFICTVKKIWRVGALSYIESGISNAFSCGHLQCLCLNSQGQVGKAEAVFREPVWSLRVTYLSKDLEKNKQRMPALSPPPFLTFHPQQHWPTL